MLWPLAFFQSSFHAFAGAAASSSAPTADGDDDDDDVVFLLPLIWRRWRRRRPTRRRPRRCSSYICRRAVSVVSVCSSVCTAARTVLHENAAASQPDLMRFLLCVVLHRTYTAPRSVNQLGEYFSSLQTLLSHHTSKPITPKPPKLNLVRIARTLELYTSCVSQKTCIQ